MWPDGLSAPATFSAVLWNLNDVSFVPMKEYKLQSQMSPHDWSHFKVLRTANEIKKAKRSYYVCGLNYFTDNSKKS